MRKIFEQYEYITLENENKRKWKSNINRHAPYIKLYKGKKLKEQNFRSL